MIIRKILRYAGITLAVLLGIVLIFLVITIVPLSRTPVREQPAYKTMMQRLDSVQPLVSEQTKGFAVGFAKVNMTPETPIALAGYGNRMGKVYSSVRDSIYVRTIVIDNGTARVAIVSADLLIIPPTVTALLQQQLPDIGFHINNTYLGSTHTHNSIGNWGEGATGILFGSYEDTVVQFIAHKIKQSIQKASANLVPAQLRTAEIPVRHAVLNRLAKGGAVDSLLRVVEVRRADSTRLLLMSFTAHATCLFSKDLALSRDYPGELVDQMEKSGYTFVMYMAGAVGSHKAAAPEYGEPCIDWMATTLKDTFQAHRDDLQPLADTTLGMYRVQLALPRPNAKVLEDWGVRPWFFRAAFGEYPVYLTTLRMGNLIMLGTPCDYSGELTRPLDSLAAVRGQHAMVTSFNGGYIGYITNDRYYDRDHYETRLMNWYGPGSGAYVTYCLYRLLDQTSPPIE
ncbi:neutral/alkaline non-lysosomal ceramidase N-terminal domain-containing protein [Parachryseolinea silvisoli]|uniref:neutral/alkaline non-lysosomal ceramidase N-terminal domain-containing protein n=1 Tax=Parachryseolinea silvisoli TaxID=2873601 RepID=UPI002265B7E7|nr:neutral/alkaline non-lysosomal ceramidase N-terminal domain-containing protein [Parachryseolinea silvisoli]MCD9014090.1 neutral/alkaline non-lysosomal ceramidase N-terminal domain-containing protein [Parachryseolinea silvisoli]